MLFVYPKRRFLATALIHLTVQSFRLTASEPCDRSSPELYGDGSSGSWSILV